MPAAAHCEDRVAVDNRTGSLANRRGGRIDRALCDSESVHFGWPVLMSTAVISPDGYGTNTRLPATAGLALVKQSRVFGKALLRPKLRAIGGIEARELAFGVHDENAAFGGGRRLADRNFEILGPNHLAGPRIEREHRTEAGRGENFPAIGGKAAAEAVPGHVIAVEWMQIIETGLLRRHRLDGPERSTVRRAEMARMVASESIV